MSKINQQEFKKRYDGCEPIAVIGASCRMPQAKTALEFWKNIANGKDLVTSLDQQSDSFESSINNSNDPDFVRAAVILEDAEFFDAQFFDYTLKEAQQIDPQQRIFLMGAWEALESAGYIPNQIEVPVGVFGSCRSSSYLPPYPESVEEMGSPQMFQTLMGNDKDYLTTRVSYKLNLKGPSVLVQTACSSSLVAVHIACEQLRNGECNVAVAGGVGITFPQQSGYVYYEGMIASPDGVCRPFDARANGTLLGNGAAMVVLKHLEDALEDGDSILGVIRGSAINNDGSEKVGFTAPSLEGQSEVITTALNMSGITPDTITLVEAHGTGTPLGDPIEVEALTQVYRRSTENKNYCALGSVKSNLGHMDTASGVTGLLKVVMALKHRKIPPSLHYETPNPEIDFENSPFYVPQTLIPWNVDETVSPLRRAALSSFGIGGTNCHMIFEEFPYDNALVKEEPIKTLTLFLSLSARSEQGLKTLAKRYVDHMEGLSEKELTLLCQTNVHHACQYDHRLAITAQSSEDLKSQLIQFSQDESKVLHQTEVEDQVQKSFPLPSRKVFLPTCPFEEERCWIDSSNSQKNPVWGTGKFSSKELWNKLRKEGATVSKQLAQGLDLSAQEMLDKHLDQIYGAYASDGLNQLGCFTATDESLTVDQLLENASILPKYRQLLKRLLRELVRMDLLKQEKDSYKELLTIPLSSIESILNELDQFDQLKPSLKLIRQCAPHLAQVLTGQANPRELIFKGGSIAEVERLYHDTEYSIYFNKIAAGIIQTICANTPKSNQIRILEIGAGTGDTSQGIIENLPTERSTYVFTDIGASFLKRAEEKFKSYPFMKYQLFDMEKDPLDQGVEEGSIDLVVAANVLHNASDMVRIMRRVRKVLAPEGIVVIRELTKPNLVFDFSFGTLVPLIEDESRRNGELLASYEVWENVLKEVGFKEITLFPENGNPTDILGEKIIIAQADAMGEFAPAWSLPMGETNATINEQPDQTVQTAKQAGTIFQLDTPHEKLSDGYLWNGSQWLSLFREVLWEEGYSSHHLFNVSVTNSFITDQETIEIEAHVQLGSSKSEISVALMLINEQKEAQCIGSALARRIPFVAQQARSFDEVETYFQTPSHEKSSDSLSVKYVGEDCLAHSHGDDSPIHEMISRLSCQAWNLPKGEIRFIGQWNLYQMIDTNELFYYVYFTSKNGNKNLNIRIFSDQKEILADLYGIVCADEKTFPLDSIPNQEIIKHYLYQKTWQKIDDLQEYLEPTSLETTCFVICEELSECQGWINWLKQEGYQTEFQAVQKLSELKEKLIESPDISKNLIYLVPQIDTDKNTEQILKEQSRVLKPCLQLLHSLEGISDNIRLSFITSNNQSVFPWEKPTQFVSSSLHGLIRTAQNEFPTLKMRCIDRDARQWNYALLTKLCLFEDYDEFNIAERQEHVFVQRLEPYPIPRSLLNLKSTDWITPGSTYLFTGGLSDLALTLSEWLIDHGATHLALLARRNPTEKEIKRIEQMKSKGVSITLWSDADLSHPDQMRTILKNVVESCPPVNAIFHLASQHADVLLKNAEWSEFERILTPKLNGAMLVDEFESTLNPRMTFFFSSAVTIFGSIGQAAHSCANSFLESFAHFRSMEGKPTQAITWGYWGEIMKEQRQELFGKVFEEYGLLAMTNLESLELLGSIFQTGESHLVAMNVNWQTIASNYIGTSALLENIVSDFTSDSLEENSGLFSASPEGRLNAVSAYFKKHLSSLLRIPIDELDELDDDNLIELGVDSLMILDLVNTIKQELNISLSAEEATEHPKIGEFITHLNEKLSVRIPKQ